MAVFEGSTASETISGTEDADTIRGNGGNDTLNGLGGDDTVEAGSGSDVIDGGTGADVLLGGGGNDIYYVDNPNDVVRDFVVAGNDGGFDTIYTTVSYSLGQATGEYVERLSARDLRGVSSLTLIGNALNNEMWGDDGVSVLDGGAGADILHGEGGNDVYFVENSRDITIEAADSGYDTIFLSVKGLTDRFSPYTLPNNLERLIATTEAGAVALAGNSLANEIVGNDFANRIYGNYANNVPYDYAVDTLIGGGGDDTYVLARPPVGMLYVDTVIEYAGGGHDTVEAGFSYTLPDNVEELHGIFFLTGNDLDNILAGDFYANDILDGRGGADILQGSGGDDVYFAADATDQVIEDANRGKDTVFIGAYDYVVPTNVERAGAMDRSGTAAFSLTGNSAGNELWGNAGANWLDGKLGLDVLTGGAGADTFAFTTKVDGDNADQFVGFEVGIDKIALDDAVFSGLAAGALPEGAFRVGEAALGADDRILYDARTGNLFFDPDGNGPAVAQYFASLHEGLSLTASDFVVI